ncbi:uncharacterized protein N7469_009070 [Penicillium citrinum]|uniref:Glyoxalase-like domain-containing protein n=2 Tax=Penicillium TaxID=5073 RepID=A0A9W9TIS6_PENCI|nr:uncharacterized protein N7469_009070 [Penicillium citrinum]KAJ5222830.1 hypothetical protein N7469_009070 [Penicillium citrinum]KAJ5580991.1 hypothetical protein N7450_007292 [Penicillium hetheringtonii]KAK5788428.1 hypothetical protein VI817_009386 [Penicillium citrinum]
MPSQTDYLPTLDHLVILVSNTTLENLNNHLQDLFTIAPGGQHANGLTWNKLVLFQDGVYLEFIAFYDTVDPEARRKHRWGNLPENTIIDWAFTYPPNNDFNIIRQHVAESVTGISYDEPAAWSRKRDDGVILEWTLSTPNASAGGEIQQGSVPFWCLDTTPRSLRVPYKEMPWLVEHSSGVRGVSSLALNVDSSEIARLSTVYGAISGTSSNERELSYKVPEGVGLGSISLEEGSANKSISLTLSGPAPTRIELLPGLVVNIEK